MIKKILNSKGVKSLTEKELKSLKGGFKPCCNPELECCLPNTTGSCGTCQFCYSTNGICV